MDPIIFVRFDEPDATMRARDAAGALDDFDKEPTYSLPPIVDGVIGYARGFTVAGNTLITARDLVSGTSLLSRDCSVRAILRLDAAALANSATNTLIVRGRADVAAEYHPFGIELRTVNLGLQIVEVRWLWQDSAGVLKTQIGAQFQADPLHFTMLTATRRWVSSTEVLLRYFVGDVMIGEVVSVDGSIGGGTTGQAAIGMRRSGGAFGAKLNADIDEIQVYDRELCAEEIAATWDRITVQQPRGYALLLELHDPGFPISDVPTSRVQRETRLWGHGLGFAAAQAENVRSNILPDRAYGDILSRWEAMAGANVKPGDSIDDRRARVVSIIRARGGASIPSLRMLLEDLANTDGDNLDFLAFDQTMTDDFTAAPREELWRLEPLASFTWAANYNRLQPVAGTYTFDAASSRNWYQMEAPVGGNGKAAFMRGKLIPTVLPANGEAGMYFGDWSKNSYMLIGLRNVAGSYKVVTESFIAGISSGLTVQATLGGLPAALWLRLRQNYAGGHLYSYFGDWSITSDVAGFTTTAEISGMSGFQLCGYYWRSNGATALTADVRFTDWRLRAPYGDRSFFFYAYRNPALAGKADVVGGHAAVAGIKQAHTEGDLITSKSVLCDDETAPCDRSPLGGF